MHGTTNRKDSCPEYFSCLQSVSIIPSILHTLMSFVYHRRYIDLATKKKSSLSLSIVNNFSGHPVTRGTQSAQPCVTRTSWLTVS